MTEDLSEEKKKQLEKEAAKKEEERLDSLVNTYFLNSLSSSQEEDKIGLNMGFNEPVDMGSGEKSKENKESISGEEEEKITGVVVEDEEEEEVFLVHEGGQITSEVKEVKEDELKEKYAFSRQTVIEKAIYNKAINSIYKTIEDYQKQLELLNKDKKTSILSKLLENDLDSFLSSIRKYRSELNATGFSQYADITVDEIDLYKIETKQLRRVVDIEIENITINLINGGIK